MNGLTTHASHDAATDFLDRVEENTRFHVESVSSHEFATADSEFRQYEQFLLFGACLVAYLQFQGVEYLYAFDDDSDAADSVSRLDTATNLYPE